MALFVGGAITFLSAPLNRLVVFELNDNYFTVNTTLGGITVLCAVIAFFSLQESHVDRMSDATPLLGVASRSDHSR